MAGDKARLQDLNNLLKTLKVTADAEHRSLIISIDIGTTYSGYVNSLFEFFAARDYHGY
jgi:hypothetical protein